jgi:hypothetical protein
MRNPTGKKLDNTFNYEVAHEFWGTSEGSVKLKNITQLIDISNPLNYIKYKLCKACDLVSNSDLEYRQGKWPSATHYIHNEEERVESEALKITVKRKAYNIINSISILKKKQLLQVIEGRSVTNYSDSKVEVTLEDIINSSPDKIIMYNEMDDIKLKAMVLIHEGVAKNVLRIDRGAYYYNEIPLGHTLNDTVLYFTNPENQSMKIAILNNIKSKQ